MFNVTKLLGKVNNSRKISKYRKEAKEIFNKTKTQTYSTSVEELSQKILQSDEKTEQITILCKLVEITTGLVPFVSQITAVLALVDGKFVEMETGEGKTLVFAMASAILSANDRKVIVTSANEYLCERDSFFASKILSPLDKKVGVVKVGDSHKERQDVYSSDVIYCDLSEVGMDYLRSAFAETKDAMFNVPFDVLLVDEADNVLLDKATSPFTVSKPLPSNDELLSNILLVAKEFAVKKDLQEDEQKEDFPDYDAFIEPITGDVYIAEKGLEKYENYLTESCIIESEKHLYSDKNTYLITLLESAISAQFKLMAGLDYILKGNKVIPLDKSSGRAMVGRFYSDGLQQMIEMKEGVERSKQYYPFTSIATQHFCQLFITVVGMSGTLIEDKEELEGTYGADIVVVERNKPLVRKDEGDILFLTEKAKLNFVVRTIAEAHKKSQPVLISTITEGEADKIFSALSSLLIRAQKITSSNPQSEASIISKAGLPGAVTVSTGMTARGTDIVLGAGNKDDYEKVVEAGGLLVIAYGKQRLAKLDRQLVGRSGRQGDPGRSMLVSSLDDDIVQPFMAKKLQRLLIDSGIDEKRSIVNAGITKALSRAQKMNLDGDVKKRKQIVQYLSEMEVQRKYIFELRHNLLCMSESDLASYVEETFGLILPSEKSNEVRDRLLGIFDDTYVDYRVKVKELMSNMGLRGTAVSNIKVEIKKELLTTFSILIDSYKEEADASLSELMN